MLKVVKELNDFRIANNIYIIYNKFVFILSVVFLAIELKLICGCLSLSRSFIFFQSGHIIYNIVRSKMARANAFALSQMRLTAEGTEKDVKSFAANFRVLILRFYFTLTARCDIIFPIVRYNRLVRHYHNKKRTRKALRKRVFKR